MALVSLHHYHVPDGYSKQSYEKTERGHMAHGSVLAIALCTMAILASPAPLIANTVHTPPRPDPAHPFTIHWEYYPPKSVEANEQGTCRVAVYIDGSGTVRAAQLRQSSGFPKLDAACLVSVKNQRMLPATDDGKPVGAWITIPIVWGAQGKKYERPLDVSAPEIMENFQLQVGPQLYPPEARTRNETGVCAVWIFVNPEGHVAQSKVLKSTGSISLDRACLDALAPANFNPAKKEGTPTFATSLLTLFWAP